MNRIPDNWTKVNVYVIGHIKAQDGVRAERKVVTLYHYLDENNREVTFYSVEGWSGYTFTNPLDS